jgi:hypothetical protein
MGVATVTGGAGRAGTGVDCLHPTEKMQTATAIQQARLNNLIEELVNSSERQPDSVVSEKNVLEAGRAAFAVTTIGIIVVVVCVKWMRVTVCARRPSAAIGRTPTLFPSQKG